MRSRLPIGLIFLPMAGVTGCQTGEPWTIECFGFQGPDHHQTAESIAAVLGQADGIDKRKVHVRHSPGKSTICYGTYHRNIDRMKGTREIPDDLRRDLGLVRELVDDRGRRLFIGARMVRKPLPDVGPAEWNLENAGGVYSLQVAAFEPTPQRRNYKQAAVHHTRRLRLRGYDAYYHHDSARAVSVVTVGIFGEDAVIKRDGRTTYNDEVRELQRKENFRYNLTNGAIWHAIIDGQKAPVRSLLVRIPRRDKDNP
ncbi:MAG: hypothetical protein V3W34_09325 [Phycisphaerae bacterium]